MKRVSGDGASGRASGGNGDMGAICCGTQKMVSGVGVWHWQPHSSVGVWHWQPHSSVVSETGNIRDQVTESDNICDQATETGNICGWA